MLSYPFKFPKLSGHLVKRVNRFVVEVTVNGRREQAYLANPGRLWELFLPGTELLLSPGLSKGKLPYTVLACRKDGRYVLLHTHLTNKVVRHLVDGGCIPFLEEYRVIREEPAYGRHRFDLLLEHEQTGAPYYLEVKSCTLFAGKVAMFPDAVTRRGADHLYRLRELSAEGINTGCLFVVMNPQAEYFLPAYHIDQNFTRAFAHVKDKLDLSAVAVGFDRHLTGVNDLKSVNVPYEILEAGLQDRGAYLLLIKLEAKANLFVGGMGEIVFKPGFYVYAGSAKRGLKARVNRHLRKKKNKRWHIDYLVAAADKITPVPVISDDDLECMLADSLQDIADFPVKGFGSSDCRCKSHLFYFGQDPLHNPNFIDLVQYYRIQRLADKLK